MLLSRAVRALLTGLTGLAWLAWLSTPAAAESAGTLPAGAAVVYGGLGVGTFHYGSSGAIRDRQWRTRADLYGAYGVSDRLQLSLDGPFVVNGVQDDPAEGPCPTEGYEGDYCDTTVSLGEIGLHARYRFTDGPKLVAGLGVRTDAWNADTRQRWTNAGLGTTSLVGSLIGGHDWESFGLVAAAHYRLTFGRVVDAGLGEVDLPGDEIVGQLEARVPAGPVELHASVGGVSRLAGVEYGDEYIDYYRLTEDRWASLRYRALRAEAKVSVPLGDFAGLHVAAGRVLIAANGPRDATDLSVGVHRYLPPDR